MEDVIAWVTPAGKRSTVSIAATAGNVVANKSPGTNKRWQIQRGRIVLVADANAANRFIILRLTDGTDVTRAMFRSGAVTAGQTRGLSFGKQMTGDGVGSLVDDNIVDISQVAIGEELLEGADQFRVVIAGGLAGDSYSGKVVVLETGI